MLKKNGKILFHHSLNKDHVTLPGGRVKDGGTTIDAIKREIKEEIGRECIVTGNVAFIQNFFQMNGQAYHEILVVHETEFLSQDDYEKEIVAIEPSKKGKLEFFWYDIDSKKYEFIPKKLLNIIKENNDFTYCINDERN